MDGIQVAVKVARKPEFISRHWKEHPKYGLVNEDVSIMDLARHENIITLLDVFSDDTYLYIVSQVVYIELGYLRDSHEYKIGARALRYTFVICR